MEPARAQPATVRTPVGRPALTLVQPRKGYRFGPENLLLPDILDAHVRDVPSPGAVPLKLVDLGAGCGVLGLIALVHLSATHPVDSLHAVERNEVLHDCLDASVRELSDALRPLVHRHHADVRDWSAPEPWTADVVLCNPPFYPPGHGRPSRHRMVHEATHALHGGVRDFLLVARSCLSASGTVLLLYPADRLAEALEACVVAGLYFAGGTIVHARHTGQPYRMWLALRPSVQGGQPMVSLSTCTPSRGQR
ncbi:MAG: hypothetical protein EA398_00825 [Deltaproteobacteria bacterium]|nr:MAG: hypothetical protein EA398_00825 [Deltaproteobacteria bacterium]